MRKKEVTETNKKRCFGIISIPEKLGEPYERQIERCIFVKYLIGILIMARQKIIKLFYDLLTNNVDKN